MKIETHRIFRRGNIHTRRLALELHLDAAAGVFVTPAVARTMPEQFAFLLDGVTDFGAWRRRAVADSPVPAAAVVEALAIVAQRSVFFPVKFCSWRPAADTAGTQAAPLAHDQGRAIYEIGAELPGLEAGNVAVALAEAVIAGASQQDLRDRYVEVMNDFVRNANRETPSPDALLIAGAARKRGIPWSPLRRSQYLHLGTGRHSSLLMGTETSHTASTNRAISRDKRLTNRILADAGLPVPGQRSARDEQAALRQARKLGFPLVVKPLDGNTGKGVTVGVQDEARLAEAFDRAREFSRRVVLEKLIPGDEYRLLVVNGRFVSAIHRRPAQVVGDGTSSVRDLVAAENLRPERVAFTTNRLLPMKPVRLDDEALGLLRDQGLGLDSVPPRGAAVVLCGASNLSRGGEPFDVTRLVHRSVREMAEQAAAAIGLDICGVDFITTDLSKGYKKTGGQICEVNSRPSIVNHVQVAGRKAHAITDAVLDMLYPNNARARLPVVVLLGQPDQTRQMRQDIEAVFARANRLLGVVPGDEGGDRSRRSTRRLKTAAMAAQDRQITAALVEITPQDLVERGLGFERVDLAVVPPSDSTATHDLAEQALRRVAGTRIAAADASDTLARALKALKLPARAVASVPADVYHLPAAEPRKRHRLNGFTALFVGDIGFGESYLKSPRAADLERLLATHGHGYSLQWLRGMLGLSDLTVANLEVPLAAHPDRALRGRKKYLGWCQPEPTLAALKEAGIDAVSLANNHTLDCGTAGLADMLTCLREAGIASFGAGRDAGAAALPFVRRFTVGGQERALVVFGGFEYRTRYDRRYGWYAGRNIAGISELSAERIARQIANLRTTLPQPTFVAFPHWGTDYEEVTQGQRVMAARLAGAGVDLIIGHGAHVVQPAEIVDGCPVIYNIGNFVWNAPGRFRKRGVPAYGISAALQFGRGIPASLRLYPILTDNAATRFQSRPVDQDEFAEVAPRISADLSAGKDEWGHYLELPLPGKAEPPARSRPLSILTEDGVLHHPL